jgi:hypothetical protein
MVDVFISYSRTDEAKVAMVARAVEAAGYDVWWDAELPPHQAYGDVITDKIGQAKAAIVVWSAAAAKSEWVRAEADMARHHRKLVQTTIDGALPPLPFNQIQYADIGDWRGEADHPGWRKVLMSLAELCGKDAPEPPPMRAAPASQAGAAARSARWPLYAAIGVAVVALALAAGLMLGRGSSASTEPTASLAALRAPPPAAPAASAPAPQAAAPADADAADVADAPADQAPVVAADAGPPPNPSDMTFADSSTRLLTPADVASLGPSTLRIAWGEIFARKGKRFKDRWLQDWFSRYAWYRPRYDKVPLNPIERHNLMLLREAEARYQ